MKNDSGASKIRIRAQVLALVLKFKNTVIPSDSEVESCINALGSIKEKDFVVSLLLKEISGSGSTYDNILSLILFNICDETFLSKKIFELLSDNSVHDNKKLFLINLLREQGEKIDYNFIQNCVKNPEEAIDIETTKFLEEAKINPETQIDFFDFYFTVGEKDRKILVESIINDYSGDNLANILAPFAYFHPNVYMDKQIIDALAKTKSYLAFEAIEFFINNSCEKELVRHAKKALSTLRTSGLVKLPDKVKLYAPLLEKSVPMGFWFSLLDGNSNVSCVFARKKTNGLVQTFFTVFNISYGVVSCFGFDEITSDDFNVILARFFKSSCIVELPLNEAKLIFDNLSLRSWDNDLRVPYEFVCWRNLTYDVEPARLAYEDLLVSNLSKAPLFDELVYKILNSDIFSSWFYDYKGLSEFSAVVDKIVNEKILNISQIEILLTNCAAFLINTSEFKKAFCDKLTLQAYLMSNLDMQSVANCLYSMCFDERILNLMLVQIMKKSLYEHFLRQKNQNCTDGRESVFTKKLKKHDSEFVVKMVELIEDVWT